MPPITSIVRTFGLIWAIGLTATSLHAAGDDDPAVADKLPVASPAVVVEAAEFVRSSLTAPDAAARTKLLNKAKARLETFLKETPTHPDAVEVELQLGAVLVASGKGWIADAQSLTEPAPHEDLINRGRSDLLKAEEYFATVIDQFDDIVKRCSWGEMNEERIRRRDRARGFLIQSQMYHAAVRVELAATHPDGSPEWRESLQAAADRYDRIYKDYRTLIAGLVARLAQGQCYKQLGDTRRALGLYDDLLTQPDELASLRRLRVSAMYLSLECWTTEQEKLYELAFSQGEEYLAHLRPEEKTWPEWQAVRYFTAVGYRLAAENQSVDKAAAKRAADRAAWLASARSHAQVLASEPGPYQSAARELDAALGQLQSR